MNLKQLIGNPEAFAEQFDDGTWKPVRTSFNDNHLNLHTEGERTYGTYVLWGDKAKTLVFDLDDGTDDETRAKAEDIAAELVRFGFPQASVGIEFSGRKGYHVWAVVADYVPAKDLRRIGRAVLAGSGIHCEVFPKQDEVRDLGNLIKLPEGRHRVSGNRNHWVTAPKRPCSKQVVERVLRKLPPEPEVKTYDKPTGVPPCLASIAEGVEEGGRNNSLYHMAVLLRGSGRLTDEQVEMLVRAANERAKPYPLDDAELEQLLDSSKYGGPKCDDLPPELQCGSACVRNRQQGLNTRPKALRYAGPGECVVMEVESKDGPKLRLTHEDMKAGGLVTLREDK